LSEEWKSKYNSRYKRSNLKRRNGASRISGIFGGLNGEPLENRA
jgi:hypothetical protein